MSTFDADVTPRTPPPPRVVPEPPSTVVAALQRDVAATTSHLADLLEHGLGACADAAAALHGPDTSWALVAGRGSSDNAGRYGSYLFGALRSLPVSQAAPSLFTRYGSPPRLDSAAVVAVSARGESRDVVSVLEEANRQGRPTIAITNDPSSAVASVAGHVVDLHAGAELAPTATRTYTASLAVFAALAAGGDEPMLADLRGVVDAVATSLADLDGIPAAAAAIASAPRVTIVGRGYNLATGNELALKLSALTSTAALSYSAADVIRGPAATRDRHPIVLIAPSGRVLSDVVDLLPALRARGIPTVIVSDVDEVLAEADLPVVLPAGVREWLSPITAGVACQRLAIEVARLQGTLPSEVVDQPAT